MQAKVKRLVPNHPPIVAYVNSEHVVAVSEVHGHPDIGEILFVGGGEMKVEMPTGGIEGLARIVGITP
jgi:hypothetical protein